MSLMKFRTARFFVSSLINFCQIRAREDKSLPANSAIAVIIHGPGMVKSIKGGLS